MAPYLMAASAAVTVAGAVQQSQAAKAQGEAAQRQANFEAQVQENNATIAGYQAIEARKAADREAAQIQEQRLRVLGQQRAATSASGLTLSGSALDVMSDSAIQAEKDIQMAKYRGDVGAYNATNQSRDLQTSSILTRMAGANAKAAARDRSTGALISGFGSALGQGASAGAMGRTMGTW